MPNEKLNPLIGNATAQQLWPSMQLLLRQHTPPVYCAAKAIEPEVTAVNALKVLGYVEEGADEFDLVEKGRITKRMARSLLYQVVLRAERAEP